MVTGLVKVREAILLDPDKKRVRACTVEPVLMFSIRTSAEVVSLAFLKRCSPVRGVLSPRPNLLLVES